METANLIAVEPFRAAEIVNQVKSFAELIERLFGYYTI
jgi:hypothetical protein